MNWITNYVRPRINSIFSRREVPENLWTKMRSLRDDAVSPRVER